MKRNVLGAAALACLLGGCGGVTQIPFDTPSPTASPTSSPAGATPTPGATGTPSQSPTGNPTATPKPTPTGTPTEGPTASAPPTASPAPTGTPTSSAPPTATPKPTATPTATPVPTPTPKGTATPTPTPSPTASPTGLPTTGPANTFPGSVLPPGTLNPSVPPGTNFDMSLWALQEPVAAGSSILTITNTQLEGGYTDTYFQTDKTNGGAMEFWDPESGAHTTNSKFPRSELREVTPAGVNANWSVSGTNTLSATLAVLAVPDHVCIGQIHAGTVFPAGLATTSLPLIELFYTNAGLLEYGLESGPNGSEGSPKSLGVTVPLGTKFSYVLSLVGSGASAKLSVSINGKASQLSFPSSWGPYPMYFKAGDYDQTAGSSTTLGARVEFYGVNIFHGP
jgi:hypothetical protein